VTGKFDSLFEGIKRSAKKNGQSIWQGWEVWCKTDLSVWSGKGDGGEKSTSHLAVRRPWKWPNRFAGVEETEGENRDKIWMGGGSGREKSTLTKPSPIGIFSHSRLSSFQITFEKGIFL
jgi:hypothetical protein